MRYLVLCLVLTGCVGVRQQDLNAWVNMPVEALDTHSFFITLPVYKTITDEGIEVRNYVNGGEVSQCSTQILGKKNRYSNASAVTNCSTSNVVCNNIFYIKDKKVIEYAPTGRCMTDDSVRPQRRYYDFKNSSSN